MNVEFDYKSYKDSVVSFMISDNIRGRFARIDKSLNDILSQHNYPEKVSGLIAETILLAVMIGQAVKLRWKLSLQIRGSGPIKLIAVDYFSPKEQNYSANIRAYAKFDHGIIESSSKDDFAFLGEGFFSVLIDQGVGTEPYQGITPLTGNSLVNCAEIYFAQSEQLPTTFKVYIDRSTISGRGVSWRGGGIMLQQLPSEENDTRFEESITEAFDSKQNNSVKAVVSNDYENWSRAKIFMNTIEEDELLGPLLKPDEVLTRLFHQDFLQIFKPITLCFGCSCSLEKVRRMLSIYSVKDIQSMTTNDGDVTADCQFCGKHYKLDPNQVGFERGV